MSDEIDRAVSDLSPAIEAFLEANDAVEAQKRKIQSSTAEEDGTTLNALLLQETKTITALRRVLARLKQGENPSLAELSPRAKDVARKVNGDLTVTSLKHAANQANEEAQKLQFDTREQHTLRRMKRQLAFRQHLEGDKLVYEPSQQPLFQDDDGTDHDQPAPIEHHDVLVVAPKGVHGRRNHFRFPVRKVEQIGSGNSGLAGSAPLSSNAAAGKVGAYDQPPELIDAYDIGERAFEMLARPQDWGPTAFRKTQRGPAFATIPVKPEPGGSDCIVCYLVNAQNLNYRNAWTAEEWNDVPDGPDLPPARNVDATTLELLLAGPRGLVFRLSLVNLDEFVPGDRIELALPRESPVEAGSLTCIDLAPQVEVWQQLRGGCVMGRALFDSDGTKRVVPLVNITTLLPD